jgi:hypothetical protein
MVLPEVPKKIRPARLARRTRHLSSDRRVMGRRRPGGLARVKVGIYDLPRSHGRLARAQVVVVLTRASLRYLRLIVASRAWVLCAIRTHRVKPLSRTHSYSAYCVESHENSRPCATGLPIRQHALLAQLLHRRSG